MSNKSNFVEKSYFNIFPFTLKIINCGENSVERTIEKEIQNGDKGLVNVDYKENFETDSCVYNDGKNTKIYLFIRSGLTTDVLVHECIHITFNIFDIIGSLINRETEEFFAYINQFIFNECYELITKEFNKKINQSKYNV